MNFPSRSPQSIALVQTAATSGCTLIGERLDGALLWLILTGDVVPGA